MKKRILFPAAAASLLSIGSVFLLFADSDVYAQKTAPAGPNVRQTASVTKVEKKSSAFAVAAAENAKLRDSLAWTFGGKSQTGWSIYVPLVAHTIGTDGGPDSPEFARALAKWQEKSGLAETGILDAETLQSFTKYWQSRRLGRAAGLSADDQLHTAPIAEFYDPTRATDLLQLERETYAGYKKMIAAAAKDLRKELKLTKNGELAPDEKFLRIVSAYRSQAYQESLRRREPRAGRIALAKNSPHSTGHALDIYVGGEPVKTLDSNRLIQVQTPVYKWLVKNAHRFGFYPYFYEPWHWEYVPKP